MSSLIEVTYEGAHNFDWDTGLEEIAERVRHDSSMNFDNMVRSIEFEFDGEEEDAENAASDLFIAAVQNTYPQFTVMRKIDPE